MDSTLNNFNAAVSNKRINFLKTKELQSLITKTFTENLAFKQFQTH